MADSTLENYSRTLARYTDLTPELLGKIVSFMQRMFTEDPSYFNKVHIQSSFIATCFNANSIQSASRDFRINC